MWPTGTPVKFTGSPQKSYKSGPPAAKLEEKLHVPHLFINRDEAMNGSGLSLIYLFFCVRGHSKVGLIRGQARRNRGRLRPL